MKTFELRVGEQRLVIDGDLFTLKNRRKLVADLDECREEYLNNINTSVEKIIKINETFAPSYEKLESENDEDYSKRITELDKEKKIEIDKIVGEESLDSAVPLAILVLQKIAELAKQENKIKPSALDDIPWNKIKSFISDILEFNDIKFAEVFTNDRK